MIMRTNAVPISLPRRNSFGYWEGVARKTHSGFYYSATARPIDGIGRSLSLETPRRSNSICWEARCHYSL